MRSFHPFLLFLLGPALAIGAWTPPKDPQPSKILEEAQKDAVEGRFDDALAKHVWFHENALKHDQGLYGIRLSFALTAWEQLGEAYPPARKKLKEVRDEAEAQVRTASEVLQPFHDFEAINEQFGEVDKTRKLFLWLDERRPAKAAQVFTVALPSLILGREYKVCGRYMSGEDFAAIREEYQLTIEGAKDPKNGERLRKFAENRFSNRTTTLIAILSRTGRKDEAEVVADFARKTWDDPQFAQQLEKALQGEVPAPWP